MATSFAASIFPNDRLWVELAIHVAGELNPDIRGVFPTSQLRPLFALAWQAPGAAAERYYAPKYRSISSNRSVIALLGKWLVSLCRSSFVKRAALISKSRMAALPTTLSPPSQPLPSAISGARMRRPLTSDAKCSVMTMMPFCRDRGLALNRGSRLGDWPAFGPTTGRS